ncbi:MAG TPA: STAS domain-containing protein [Anaerolineae bacterium]|nr:STAS domain-containing protein [Anaerolineae bacterium]HMR67184.1 STAS domain-containing protein [Anaerolineae bacterium]
MDSLHTELSQAGVIWTLKLIGSIGSNVHHLMWNEESSAALLTKLKLAQAKALHIDLKKTERLDSQALRLLLNAQKDFSQEQIEIVLKNPNDHLNRLLHIMQFDKIFSIEFDN